METTETNELLTFQVADGHFVCNKAGKVVADSAKESPGETFQVVKLDGGKVALLSVLDGYLGVGEANMIVCSKKTIEKTEIFDLIRFHEDTKLFALKASNGKYVSAEGCGGGRLIAEAEEVGKCEKFREVSKATRTSEKVAFQTSNAHYLVVGAPDGKITATAKKIGLSQIFEKIELGEKFFVLKSLNGRFVTLKLDVEELFASQNIITRLAVFELDEADRVRENVGIRALANRNFVCALEGGGGKVAVDRNRRGPWETFGLIRFEAGFPVVEILEEAAAAKVR